MQRRRMSVAKSEGDGRGATMLSADATTPATRTATAIRSSGPGTHSKAAVPTGTAAGW